MVLGVGDLLGGLVDAGLKKVAENQFGTAESPTPSLESPNPSTNVNTDSSLMATSGDFNTDSREVSLYRAYRELGQNDFAARALVAEVGRENAFQDKYLFGSHIDPANGKVNAGIFSWQKERSANLLNNLAAAGVYNNGKIDRSYAALKAMAKFSLDEMNSDSYGSGKILSYLNSDNPDQETAFRMLGKDYIKWRYDDPAYANHHNHRNAWFNKITDAVQGLAPLGKYIVENHKPNSVVHSDFSYSKQQLEDVAKINKLAQTEATIGEKLYAVGSFAMAQGETGKKRLQQQEIEKTIAKIAKDTGVAYANTTNPFGYVENGVYKPAMTSNTPTDKDEAMSNTFNQASVTAYLNKVRESNPNYVLPVQSYNDMILNAGKEFYRRAEAEDSALRENGSMTAMAYRLAGGLPAMLADPVNLAANVAGVAVGGGTGLIAKMAINAGVNMAAEGAQLGIESVTDTRRQMNIEGVTKEEAGLRLGMAAGLGALFAGGVHGIGKGVELYKARKSITGAVAADAPTSSGLATGDVSKPSMGEAAAAANTMVDVELKGQVMSSPFEDTALGRDLLNKAVSKAATDADSGLPTSVVPDDMPTIRMSYEERTGLDFDKFVDSSVDLTYLRGKIKSNKEFYTIQSDDVNTTTATEYTRLYDEINPELLSKKQQLDTNNTLVDKLQRDIVEADKVRIEADKAKASEDPITSIIEGQKKLRQERYTEAKERRESSEPFNATELTDGEPISMSSSEPVVHQEPKLSEPLLARVATLENRLGVIRRSEEQIGLSKQSAAFENAELVSELRATKEQFKNDSTISKERRQQVLDDINEDLKANTERLRWQNDRAKRAEDLKTRITSQIEKIKEEAPKVDVVVEPSESTVQAPKRSKVTSSTDEATTTAPEAPIRSPEAKASQELITKLNKDMDRLQKLLDDNDPDNNGTYLWERSDLEEPEMLTKQQYIERVQEEKTATEMIINCVLGLSI